MSVVKRKSTFKNDDAVALRLSDFGLRTRTSEEADLQIQKDRIVRVLDDSITKLKIAACIPVFLQDKACWLRKHCRPHEVEYINRVCSKYTSSEEVDSQKLQAFKTIHWSSQNSDEIINPDLARVLQLLWNNTALREKSLNDFDGLVGNNAKSLINCVNHLKRIAQLKFSESSSETKSRDKQLRKIFQENEKMKKEIEDLQSSIQKQRNFFQSQIDQKNLLLSEGENKYDAMMNDFKRRIAEKVNRSEKVMAITSAKHKNNVENLTNDVHTIRQQYESLLAAHQKVEKKLRSKRFKIETQVASWLNKFDEDMTVRQEQFDELKNAYENGKIEMGKLQEEFNIQEKEYLIVMQEKADEERWQLELLIQKFRRIHAARIIQRYWRAYIIRKLERKKRKKGKGKRK